jgi:AI-2 transport protein TqsA
MNQIKSTIIPTSLVILCILAITTALFFMKTVLVPFVFSLMLFFLIEPMMCLFKTKFKCPRAISIFLTFSLLFLGIALLILFIGISFKGLINSGDVYQHQVVKLLDLFSGFIAQFGLTVDLTIIKQAVLELPILTWFQSISGSIVGIVGNLLLVLIFTFFLIVGNQSSLRSGMLLDDEMKRQITRYITVKCMISFCTASIIWILFASFNVQLAMLFAVLTFFLNFIPSVGSIIAVLIPLPVIFLQFGYSWQFLVLISAAALIQFIIGNIIDPKLMGDRLGLHPVIILLSLLFWGFIWGVPGMFLSAPITSIIKLLCSRFKLTKPLVPIFEGTF